MKPLLNMIKKITLMGILLILANCKKDSDPIPTPNDLIIGNWTVSTFNLTIKVGTQSFVDYLIAQGLTASEAQLYVSEFTSDYGPGPENINIMKGGTYSYTSQGLTDTGMWELTADGKTLTLDKGTAAKIDFTVTTLSSTNLNLAGDLDDSDSDVILTIHYEIALTK